MFSSAAVALINPLILVQAQLYAALTLTAIITIAALSAAIKICQAILVGTSVWLAMKSIMGANAGASRQDQISRGVKTAHMWFKPSISLRCLSPSNGLKWSDFPEYLKCKNSLKGCLS